MMGDARVFRDVEVGGKIWLMLTLLYGLMVTWEVVCKE